MTTARACALGPLLAASCATITESTQTEDSPLSHHVRRTWVASPTIEVTHRLDGESLEMHVRNAGECALQEIRTVTRREVRVREAHKGEWAWIWGAVATTAGGVLLAAAPGMSDEPGVDDKTGEETASSRDKARIFGTLFLGTGLIGLTAGVVDSIRAADSVGPAHVATIRVPHEDPVPCSEAIAGARVEVAFAAGSVAASTDERGAARASLAEAGLGGENGRDAAAWRDFVVHVAAEEGTVERRLALGDGEVAEIARAIEQIQQKDPPRLVVTATFDDARGDGDRALDAEEVGSVEVVVENRGRGPAFGVNVRLEPRGRARDVRVGEPVVVGRVDPGESARASVSIAAGERLSDGEIAVQVRAEEKFKFDATPVELRVASQALRPPDLVVAGREIRDDDTELSSGNGDRKVQAQENVALLATVANRGPGAARDVKVRLGTDAPADMRILDAEADVGSLPAGAQRVVRLRFRGVWRDERAGKKLPLRLVIAEAHPRFGRTVPLDLVAGETVISTLRVSSLGQTSAPAASDVDDPPPGRAPSRDAVALVVGIERYRDLPGAPYARADAETMRDYLVRVVGVPEENVAVKTDDRATRADLGEAFEDWLPARVQPGQQVFVYYAGHGAPGDDGKEAYLVPYDGNPGNLRKSGYPLRQLYRALDRLPTANVNVILDACFSGVGERSVMARGARALVRVEENAIAGGARAVVLASSRADQMSLSYGEKRHGLFTYYLFRALRGEADGDRDGAVTLRETFAYVSAQVRQQAGRQMKRQEPVLLPDPEALGARADVPLAVRR